MRAICDYLLSHEKKVIAVGQCMSAATAIIACGSPALCSPSTRFMVHRTSLSEASDGVREMVNNAEELRIESNWYFDILEARTKTHREQWEDLCREETIFGADLAKTLGLVDGIL